MKTAQELFEEWQKLMVAAKCWTTWEQLENWERRYWVEEENKQNNKI